MSTVLAFDDVTFGYGRPPVLQHAGLRVEAGEFVAVIGANGSGKTTLMRLGLGLEHAQTGTVSLFGTPVDRFHDWHRVGYVPQRAGAGAAIPLSVEEVVGSGLAARLGPLRRPDRDQRARLAHVLELTGLAGLHRRPMALLSGGQQQRALIARALVTGPELLVLDEPTTGVDADARVSLRESLQHLVGVEGVAVVYVSHDPEGFAGLADRVVEVRAGRVLPCDDPSAHGHRHHGSSLHPGGTP